MTECSVCQTSPATPCTGCHSANYCGTSSHPSHCLSLPIIIAWYCLSFLIIFILQTTVVPFCCPQGRSARKRTGGFTSQNARPLRCYSWYYAVWNIFFEGGLCRGGARPEHCCRSRCQTWRGSGSPTPPWWWWSLSSWSSSSWSSSSSWWSPTPPWWSSSPGVDQGDSTCSGTSYAQPHPHPSSLSRLLQGAVILNIICDWTRSLETQLLKGSLGPLISGLVSL